jgi:hypothetical protein
MVDALVVAVLVLVLVDMVLTGLLVGLFSVLSDSRRAASSVPRMRITDELLEEP